MVEIERRYLLRSCDTERLRTYPSVRISQGYMRTYQGERPNSQVWVRVTSGRDALMGIKEGHGVLRRSLIQRLSFPVARALLELAADRIDKERYTVPGDGCHWDIDRYAPPFEHIVIAEFEPDSIAEIVVFPDWFGAPLDVTNRLSTADIARAMSVITKRFGSVVMSRLECERFSDAASLLERETH